MKHASASLRFSLDNHGAAYYQQLMTQIQQGIVSGALSVGDKLPSSRALASTLGVSRSTTSKAYEHLVAEGILLSEEKRGVFVAAQPLARQVRHDTAGLVAEKEPQTQAWRFDSGVDVAVFPNKEWAASMRRSWLNPDSGVLQGKYHTGLPDLKVAIVDYLYRVRGMRCSAEQIIVTAGSRDSLILLHHALASLPTPNATIAAPSAHSEVAALSWWLEDPTYPPLREVLSQQGTLSFLPIDEEGARLPTVLKTKRAKQQATNVALLTPNRQYPLGLNMSPSRRQQWLLKLQSSAENWWFIEDDYDNEFVYQGRVDVPFMQTAALHEGAMDRTFFMGSFSKVLFRGLRLGFIVAPRVYLAHLSDTQRTIGFSASLPIQPAVADFMQRGGFDRHLNRMRRHYRLKRDALLTLLSEQLSEWCEWQKPQGGMHVLVEIKSTWLGSREDIKWDQKITQDLVKEGVVLSPLTHHFSISYERQGFILGFSGSSIETMRQSINVLKKWFLSHNR
ncbi:PLP-dependent aminotransferase family protein [Marinomonas pollencensis]|uniref:GntR family transcriptional regulator n=1 Tax=Marinomonas pollencensis TaxID=491954 RepID=A0A3E0DM07_9GAMM|nr:PLP-dependent aminotransferase family protein [Marinomonas pollencensis]REG83814.1 GntR family transcriptional regulator [Marinomonas pollencensis]